MYWPKWARRIYHHFDNIDFSRTQQEPSMVHKFSDAWCSAEG
jgi:hypothetical protein